MFLDNLLAVLWLYFWQLKPKLILTEKFDFLEMEISNCTSYFLESRQPTQATTIENLKYETSCRNATLLIKKLSVGMVWLGKVRYG